MDEDYEDEDYEDDEYYEEGCDSEEELDEPDCNVPDLLMAMSLGDDGQVAITKIGGAPWWPQGEQRPVCVNGHSMAFIAQIRIDEIPGFDQPPTLLSFHYCDECTFSGRMPFGWRDPGYQRRYSVRLFDELHRPVDGLHVTAPSRVEPRSVVLHEGIDVLKSLEGRSKLGGAPHWWQNPEYPEDDLGEPMRFVGQLGCYDFPKCSWNCGGIFLFVSEYDENEEQQADMVLQST